MRVMVIDDEPPARRALIKLLAAHPALELVGECGDPLAAPAAIAVLRPDALFLDVSMPGLDGFALFGGLALKPKVVFVTGQSNHAHRAFDIAAVDYLVKPVEPERFAVAVKRLREAHAGGGVAPADPATLLSIPAPPATHRVDPARIIALFAQRDFTRVVCDGHGPILASQTLGQFEQMLPAGRFARPHRSLILNLARIERIEARGRRVVVVMAGLAEPIELGREPAQILRARLEGVEETARPRPALTA